MVRSFSGNGTSRRTDGPEPTSGFGVKQTLSMDGNDAIDPNRTSRAHWLQLDLLGFARDGHSPVGLQHRLHGRDSCNH